MQVGIRNALVRVKIMKSKDLAVLIYQLNHIAPNYIYTHIHIFRT